MLALARGDNQANSPSVRYRTESLCLQTISLRLYLFLAGCLSFLLNLFGISEGECNAASDIQVGTTLIEISVICTSLLAFNIGYLGALEACRRVGAMEGD